MNKYIKRSKLGEGAFGETWLVQEKATDKQYVMKSIKTDEIRQEDIENAEKEADQLQELGHPFIVEYHESFRENNNFHIVMEYANGGDLGKRMEEKQDRNEKFSESEILKYFVQILLAVRRLHSKDILHRDLKPENIFLTSEDIVKLGDFGLSKKLESPNILATSKCGTPLYIAPEITKEEPYNRKADIWSLGIILYELITSNLPFDIAPLNEYYKEIREDEFKPLPDETPEYMKNIVARMLSKDPNERPDVDDILAIEKFRIKAFDVLEKQVGKEKVKMIKEINNLKQDDNLKNTEIERLKKVAYERLNEEEYERLRINDIAKLEKENKSIKSEFNKLKGMIDIKNNEIQNLKQEIEKKSRTAKLLFVGIISVGSYYLIRKMMK